MTWRAIDAHRACSIVDFWIAARWPLCGARVRDLAAELGWTVDAEGTLVNSADGLSQPAVLTGETRGTFASLTFWVTDVVKGDDATAGDAFLGDRFALLVREVVHALGQAEAQQGQGRAGSVGADRGAAGSMRRDRSCR